jgi:ribonuclease P protein component
LADSEADGKAPWGRLTRRAEYQRAGRGKRVNAGAFTLQANARGSDADPPRFGLTVTKKTGNSPVRHRIKRRFREAMRLTSPLDAKPGHDYVLMARREALSIRFDALVAEIARALSRAHARRDR